MKHRLVLIVTAGFLAATVGTADVVHFANGRSLEGVIAEETETHVRIKLAFGEIQVPRDKVVRIERVASALEVYLERKQELEADPDHATAEDWLGLALWARGQDLMHGFREAGRRAAELDPRLEGLAPAMAALDYVFDAELGRWIPYAESMRRQGYVQYQETWIPRQEHTEIMRAQRAELEARREARRALALQVERERRIAEDAVRMALAEQQRLVGWHHPWVRSAPVLGFGFPGFLGVPVVSVDLDVSKPRRPDRFERDRVRPPVRHRGGFTQEQIERAPGSLRAIGMDPHRPGSLRPPAPIGGRQ